jgi:uncharacterized protein
VTAFAREQRLTAAHFTAIDALSDAMLGYFDRTRKNYTKIHVDEIGAHVWLTLELILTASPGHLRRRSDPETGLALLDTA